MSRSSFLRPLRRWPTSTYHRFARQQSNWQRPTTGKDTGISIYNCIARKQVPLILANDNYATWYTCGPTVYDSTHLGHASCYVKLDIIQRILRQHFNVNLVTAMNITDIDDKIIRRSMESGKDWRELARCYESEFWTNMQQLNVQEPNVKIRVTEQMPRIINFIAHLLEQGDAYKGSDGSIYFAVNKYPNYGKLQRINLEDAGETQAQGKLSNADFALWKTQKSTEEPAWSAPWGAGRPGWHIECSALASMLFGQQLDFHAGGLDLRFPHHENEEAQSCAYHKREQWVNYWLHTGQLHIHGQTVKMSKSLKNTISISEMLERYTADDFRMACVLSNYRNSVDYSDALMETSRNTLKRFRTFKANCHAYLCGGRMPTCNSNAMVSSEVLNSLQCAQKHVDSCYKDDFDTARTIAVLLEQVNVVSRHINATTATTTGNATAPAGIIDDTSHKLSTGNCLDAIAAVVNFVEKHLSILGFTFVQDTKAQAFGAANEIGLEALVEGLLEARRSIRERAVTGKNKELFRICDELRNCLRQNGIDVQDRGQSTSWHFSGVRK